MTAAEFIARLGAAAMPKQTASGWECRCPAHDDNRASLSVSDGKKGTVVFCHAGCEAKAICAAVGVQLADLFADRPERNGQAKKIVATYDYRDEFGALLFQVCRFEPKDFRQRRPDLSAKDGWTWKTKGVPRVLYRLPETLAAVKSGQTIFICEGEKDVAALVVNGFAATCNCGGASKWLSSYNGTLARAPVVIIADKDEPGRKHAAQVAKNLDGVAASVRVVELPDFNGSPVKDAGDFFAAGATREDFERAIAANAKPLAPHDLEKTFGAPVFKRPDGAIASINERFFAARFHAQGNILYEPTERAFYSYNERTGIWRRETDDAVREAVSASVLDYGRNTGLFLDAKISAARMNGIVHALRAIAERRDAFQKPRDFVHVENGVVRFPADGRIILTGFSRDDFSRNRSPVAFDKAGECPRFINDLLRPALPDEDIDVLQCWTGLAIAGVNPAQRFIVLDGGPATGKTTSAKTIQAIVGAENCTQLRTALLNERFEIFRFIGKTLLLAPDVPGDFLNRAGASQLKALVGSDPLTAEAKGSNDGFDLAGNFNVLITSNTRLRVRLDGDAGAWRRRLIILRFERPPPAKRIPNFAEKLVAEEGAGILRWALAGLLHAREQLAANGDLVLTRAQQGRVDALLSESDSIRRFVSECTARGDGTVTSHELVEGYFHFCASNEWTPQPVRVVERTLADAILETHGQSRAQDIGRGGKSVRGWRNVILTTEAVPV